MRIIWPIVIEVIAWTVELTVLFAFMLAIAGIALGAIQL